MSGKAEHPRRREKLQLPGPAARASWPLVAAAVAAQERGCVFQGQRMELNAPRQRELGLFIRESLSYCVMIAHIILCKWVF